MSEITEVYLKESWTGGYRRLRIIWVNGEPTYPDGVPIINNRPRSMTVEHARQAFEAYGYRRAQ